MKQRTIIFAVIVIMAMAIPQSVKAYDFSKAYQGQMLYYTIIDSVNHYVMLTCPKDTIIPDIWPNGWSTFTSGIYGGNSGIFEGWDHQNKPTGALTLPDTVSYDEITYIVRAIGKTAFYGCPIFSVVMPNTVDSLGDLAFGHCTYLSNVTFSNTLRHIGKYAFHGTNLGDVVLPASVRLLDKYAFEDAHITSITLSDSLQNLEKGCLASNNFTTINIPASVSYIDSEVFSASEDWIWHEMGGILTSITVDANNPYYDSRENCNAIINSTTDVLIAGCMNTIIPAGVYGISEVAFGGCNFDILVLPNTIVEIRFRRCHVDKLVVSSPTMLMYIYHECHFDTIQVLNTTPPFLGILDYNGFGFDSRIIVPCNTLSAYQAADGWDNYSDIIESGTPTIAVNTDGHGTASVLTYPSCGHDTATVSATATAEHYHFSHWSDGSTENPHTLALSSNTTLTAHFAIDNMTVTTISSDPSKGIVLGGGTVPYGGTTTLTAAPIGSNVFLCWSNGVTANPYTLTVTSDTSLAAMFTVQNTIVVHDTVTLTDTVVCRYYMVDTTIVNNYVYDTVYQRSFYYDTAFVYNYIHDTIWLTRYVFDTADAMAALTAFLDSIMHDTAYLDENVLSELYAYIDAYLPDTVTVTDTIIEYLWMHDTVYIHDTVYVGVDEVEAVDVKLYQRDGNIVVEGADGNAVMLYDAVGRKMCGEWRAEAGELRIPVPTSGVYLIKIGNYPARKVVVIK